MENLNDVEAAILKTEAKIAELEENIEKYKQARNNLVRQRYELKRKAEAEAKAAALAKAPVVLVDANFGQAPTPVKLVKTEVGTIRELKGKQVRVGVEWEIYRDGVYIGTVTHRLFTRERGPAGARYVHSRWESMGWGYASERAGRQLEAFSKRDAIERIVRAAGR